MMPADVPTLKGVHVTLEPLNEQDAEELWHEADDPDVWRHMPAAVKSVEDLRAWIRARRAGMADGTAQPFVQRHPWTGAAMGSTSLFDMDLRHRRGEVGHTWLGREHRRTGVNTEAKLLLLAHAFETMGLRRVQFKTDLRNIASQKALERIGATREGVLRRHMALWDGSVRDSVVYSVVDDEWPATKARLRKLLAEWQA